MIDYISAQISQMAFMGDFEADTPIMNAQMLNAIDG